MSKVLEMPKLSPTMEEGQISAWHKKPGDAVGVDDLLAEVETDKATMEYRSFDKGTLLEILAPAGTVVKLGQPVAVLGDPGEKASVATGNPAGVPQTPPDKGAEKTPEPTKDAPAKDEAKAKDEPKKADAPKKEAGDKGEEDKAAKAKEQPAKAQAKPREEAEKEAPKEPAKEASGDGRLKASPYVRKLAREKGLSLDEVAGSGPNGRIVARDVEGLEKPAPKAAPAAAPRAPGELAAPESRPLSMMRKAIAKRLTESKQTVPHFYLTIDVDADPLHHLREQINADLAASAPEGQAPKVSFNDLLIKACAIALVRVPECNAQFTAEAILVHKRVDISVAVAVPDGLITPVVRDADKKSVLAISAEVRELAARAKAKKLKPEEMQNGTFSISNLGMYGIDAFAAVINPPEGAILAVGGVRREPVVKGEAVVAGRRLAMTLSCDHRVVDGAVGATFLKALRALCEHPTQILL
jgi:pyruvate dehydrogenase E2 component (dihydrolipoamide acetyltransferase)